MGGDKLFTLSELEATTMKCIPDPATRVEQLTFDPDVAVPLEVVVGGFPGVAVVAQERDGRARPDGDVAHSFLICRTGVKEGRKEERKKEGGEVNDGGDGEGGRVGGATRTHVFPGRRLAALRAHADGPAGRLLLVRAVGLHHLALLRGDDVLLLAGLLPGGGAGDEIPRGRGAEGGGLSDDGLA